MTKWSKDKTKEQVLTDVKEIFDKYGVTKAIVVDGKFWTCGAVEEFFVDMSDASVEKQLQEELCDYFFDLETFPDGNCGALVDRIDSEHGSNTLKHYNKVWHTYLAYDNGKWVI